MLISSEQVRAARALLKWSQADLAAYSGVSVPAIANIEVDKQQANTTTQEKLAKAFIKAGIDLIDGGVRRTKSLVRILQGEDANARFIDELYETMKDSGGEVLISGLIEPDPTKDKKTYDLVKAHIAKLQDAGINERILIREGDKNIIAPADWYRAMPKEYFAPFTYQMYGNRLGIIDWGPPQEVIVIESERVLASFRHLFNFAWQHAKPIKGEKS